MAKLKLELDELRVETFDTVGARRTPGGTVHALSASRGDAATCGYQTCGEWTCVDAGCGGTYEASCDYVACGESVSCTTDVCNESNWANQCTYDGKGGETCGSYVC